MGEEIISEIDKLEAFGGTDILKAFQGAYNLMSNKKECKFY